MKPILLDGTSLPAVMPGDVCLYGGEGFVDRAIQFRTWSDVSHIEVFVDDVCERSVASRNGIGVGIYPFRTEGLRYVLRPVHRSFDLAAGMRWFRSVNGTPYGWGDLGRFYLLNLPTQGLICSQFGDLFFEHAKCPLFSRDYYAGSVPPSYFLTVGPLLLRRVWQWEGAKASRRLDRRPKKFRRDAEIHPRDAGATADARAAGGMR